MHLPSNNVCDYAKRFLYYSILILKIQYPKADLQTFFPCIAPAAVNKNNSHRTAKKGREFPRPFSKTFFF